MPAWPEVLGFVHVSTYKSWKDLGRWYWGFVKDQFDLDDETRRALALAVSDEIGRLQRMVGASQHTNHPVSFRLSDIVRPQVDLVRAQGAQVDAQVPDDLVAYGRPADFAEVLQNLLVNARVHGRNPITVRAAHDSNHIILYVEDRGPGVPVPIRAAIFERGRRASDAPGSGEGDRSALPGAGDTAGRRPRGRRGEPAPAGGRGRAPARLHGPVPRGRGRGRPGWRINPLDPPRRRRQPTGRSRVKSELGAHHEFPLDDEVAHHGSPSGTSSLATEMFRWP